MSVPVPVGARYVIPDSVYIVDTAVNVPATVLVALAAAVDVGHTAYHIVYIT